MRPAPLIVALVAGSLSATGFAPLDLWPVLLAALAVCRPLPFVEAAAPTLSDVAGDLGGWRGGKDEEA